MPAAKALPKLNQAHIEPHVSANKTWTLRPPAGLTVKDLVESDGIFNNVARQLRPFDLLYVTPQDGTYFAIMLVAHVDGLTVRVEPLVEKSLQREVPSDAIPKGYRIEFIGPHEKFRVMRDKDNAVLKAGFQSKHHAAAWLSDHLSAAQRAA